MKLVTYSARDTARSDALGRYRLAFSVPALGPPSGPLRLTVYRPASAPTLVDSIAITSTVAISATPHLTDSTAVDLVIPNR